MSKPVPDAHLYGFDRPKKKQVHKEISSSTTLAFTSQLSSLLSSTSTTSSGPSRGRPRSSAPKESIFTKHNKNTQKRALADLQASDALAQTHSTSSNPLDAPDAHRSKRKMREKARIYASLKRGDYVSANGDADPDSLVDFDRKWAEGQGDEDGGSSDDSDADPDQYTQIEYEDEFGRMRTGTRADKERVERRRRNMLLGQEELERMSARPVAPSNVIRGPTIQHQAFNPDEATTARMAELAGKRDRSATPPEETHYEADKEMRRRGTGFFAFEKGEGRKRQMEGLEEERRETERVRGERGAEKEKRRAEIEARRKEIAAARAKKQADAFLGSFVPESSGGNEEVESAAEVLESPS